MADALALRPVLFDREAPVQGVEVVFTLVRGSFAACRLIAWRRRPDSRSGMLMTATGFLFFVGPLLGQLDGDLANTLRVLAVDYWIFRFVAPIRTLLEAGGWGAASTGCWWRRTRCRSGSSRSPG